MKILSLRLQAFGPFTGEEIDLSEGSQGLHLIYGRNEAGKSSALRAVRDLLYGIPARSPDDFVHAYAKMRIAAVLRHSDGSQLGFVRRKGNLNTLRDEDDRDPLADDCLDKFLAGVDADLFETTFGIDHERLVRGGRDIARGGGRIGEILFAAGSGVADLRKVQEDLQSEMDLIFKPGGRKQKINDAIQRLHDARSELKKLHLSSDEWSRHRRALEEANRRNDELGVELAQARSRLGRLVRLRDAMPAIARWRQLRADLKPYQDVPLLPEDFGRIWPETSTRLREAEKQRRDLQQAMRQLDEDLRQLNVCESVLEQADAIEELRERLGSYRKAAADRPGLVSSKGMADRDADEILRKLGRNADRDEAEKLRLPADKAVLIQNLGGRQQALAEKLDAARRKLDRTRRRIAETEQAIEALDVAADTTQLRQLVRSVRQRGDLESESAVAAEERQRVGEEAAVRLGRLGLWSGSLEKLEELAVPSEETIDRFDQQFRDLDARLAGLRERRREETDTVEELETKLRQLELAQPVPSEEDLHEARQLRQGGWRLVRAAWEGTAAAAEVDAFLARCEASRDLADAYQRCVEKADELADRLRREADRVAQKAKLRADRDRARQQSDSLGRELEAAKEEAAALARQWNDAWTPLGTTPLSPREMRAWLRVQGELLELASRARHLRAKTEQLGREIETHRRRLGECLGSFAVAAGEPDEPLSAMLERAEAFLDQAQQQQKEWARLHDALHKLREELVEAEADDAEGRRELADWQARWTEAIAHLGLGQNATAAEANAVIAHVSELFARLHEAGQFRLRLDGIDEDARQFTSDVRALVGKAAPELADLGVEDAVTTLSSMLSAARAAKEKQNSLVEQKTRCRASLAETEKAFRLAEEQLRVMCAQADCDRPELLAEAEQRSDRRRELETSLRAVEDQILSHSGGAALGDFVREADTVDADAIPSRVAELENQVDRIGQELKAVNQTIGEQRKVLGGMDGNARAAEKAEQCEELAAGLGEDVRQFAVLRLAATVLREAVERYRAKNQGPILDRAGRLFAELTAGSFDGLRTDFDGRGELVLLGLRAGGEETLGVEAMSDGTCDQLYLALRIASIENWLENHEPIPFIVDDVLLNFDDQRAAAALRALGELSRHTQVIFFTHHQHLVEMAEEHLPAGVLSCHRLHFPAGRAEEP